MKPQTASARIQRIMTLLRDRGELRTGQLSRELCVTSMTIWRDLGLLAEQGLIRRVRGGAEFLGRAMSEPDFEAKAALWEASKALIAEAAVQEFVRDGHTIAMEGGTTVAALVEALPDQRISVVTNSLPIALRIRARRPALPVRVIGGWLSPVSGNTTGPEALKSAEMVRSSVCFLGASGWDEARGPMDPNPLEIEVKRQLARNSDRVVLLMDSQKFLTTSASVMIHPRRLHALVTDALPPESIVKRLHDEGVRLVIARASH